MVHPHATPRRRATRRPFIAVASTLTLAAATAACVGPGSTASGRPSTGQPTYVPVEPVVLPDAYPADTGWAAVPAPEPAPVAAPEPLPPPVATRPSTDLPPTYDGTPVVAPRAAPRADGRSVAPPAANSPPTAIPSSPSRRTTAGAAARPTPTAPRSSASSGPPIRPPAPGSTEDPGSRILSHSEPDGSVPAETPPLPE